MIKTRHVDRPCATYFAINNIIVSVVLIDTITEIYYQRFYRTYVLSYDRKIEYFLAIKY